MQFFTRFVRGRRGNLATRAAFALGAALAFPDTQNAQAAGAPELGVWINHEGKGAVEIKQCGAALCGNIVWLKSQVNDQGQPLFDRRNPDESKRTRPICGLPVIGNVKRTSEGWDEGWIYNPEEGAQYDVSLAASGDRLTVTGYKGIKLFSKTFTWTRAPADLQRCDGAPPSDQTKAKPSGVPAKLAAPKPADGTAAPALKKPATAAVGGAPAAPTAKAVAPTAKTAATPGSGITAAAPKKLVAKDPAGAPATAKAPNAATAATKKPAATGPPVAKAAALDKSGKPVPAAAKTAAKQPAGAPANAKKPVTTTAVPVPTAATRPAAKKPATTTASTADDTKPAAAPAKKPAAKPAPKKETADEDDASSAVE